MSKHIIIRQLDIRNFKGIQSLNIEFNPTRPTIISGKNATGKTTVMDAFMWLLWGTNSESQQPAKFGIKPNDKDGNPRLDLDTEVEGIVDVIDTESGETDTTCLKRKWVSVWKTKSGETEKTFDKNKGQYFINDVPVKESEYNEKVGSLIPPEIFRTLTDPYYFAKLPWEKKRAILMGLAKDVTYEDVAKQNEAFAKFMADLSGKTISDFAKEIGAGIGRINKRLNEIPFELNEAERAKPAEASDYEQLEDEKKEAEKEIEAIDAATASAAEASRQRFDQNATIYKEMDELRKRMSQHLQDAREAEWERTKELNAEHSRLFQEQNKIENSWTTEGGRLKNQMTDLERCQQRHESDIARMEQEQNSLREKWYTENAKQYTPGGELVCPITNQFCTDPNACLHHSQNEEAARNAFRENQRKTLEQITSKGRALGTDIVTSRRLATEAMERIAKLKTEYAAAQKKHDEEAAKIAEALKANPRQKQRIISGEELPQWVKWNKELLELQNKIYDATTGDNTESIEREKRKESLKFRIEQIIKRLAERDMIAKQDKRIAELQKEEKQLLQERADLQKKEMTIDQMTKARMSELERRINSQFKMVRFEMFERTMSTGEEKPNCVCWVGEAKYNDKNRAAKVNAGLDIINTLCERHKIHAPVFIDNAECVNKFIDTESQLVLLQVTTEDFKITN